MSLSRRAATALILAVTLSAFVGSAQAERVLVVPTEPDSGIAIRLSSDWAQTPRFGFAPVRVSIENNTTSEHTWQAEFRAGHRNFFPGEFSTSVSITVPSGQRRERWVFISVAEPNSGGAVPAIAGPSPAPFPGAVPKVTIAGTSTGSKVTSVLTFPSGSGRVTETEINTITGQVTVTTTLTPAGKKSTRHWTAAPGLGRNVVFSVDPTTGAVTSTNVPIPPGTLGTASVVTGRPMGGASAVSPMPVNLVAVISGPGVSGDGLVSFPYNAAHSAMQPVAVSPTLEQPMRAKLSAVITGDPNLSTVTPDQYPADWRVWSPYSCVLLRTDEYERLDAGRRAALQGWVALGGQLCLSPASANEAGVENLGAGIIVKLAAPFESDTDTHPSSSGTSESDILGPQVALFTPTVGLPDRGQLAIHETALPASLTDDGPNIAWLAVFVLVFASVIGPINLFVFAPAAKRHRLFITTPLIALGASLVLVVMIFAQDGLGGTGTRSAVVILLRGENQAVMVQEQFVRTGFLLHRDFDLPADVLLSPLAVGAQPAFGGPMLVDARQENRATGDWFRSRNLHAQQLRRVTATRARIERVGLAPNGAPIVQSSLGTTLRSFVYVDDSDVQWTAATLPSGQRVTLEKASTGRIQLSLTESPNLQQIADAAVSSKERHWFALGDATELAPLPTLDSIRWTKSDIVYTGELEGESSQTAAQL